MVNGTSVESFQGNRLAGSVIFVIASTSMLANGFVATTILRLPTMKSSFGRLLTSQSIADAVSGAVFAFLYSTTVFFDVIELERISPIYASILQICYNISLFSHFFISLNRLCAICMPFHFKRYFSRRNTFIFIAALWVVAIAFIVVPYFAFQCHLFYDSDAWALIYVLSQSCQFIGLYTDAYRCLSLLFFIAIVDTITVTKVRLMSKIGAFDGDANRKRELNLLKQAVLQTVAYIFEIFCYFFLSTLFTNKWVIWCCTIVVWNSIHCLDAFIVIGLNAEFRRIVRSPKLIFNLRTAVNTTKIIIVTQTNAR